MFYVLAEEEERAPVFPLLLIDVAVDVSVIATPTPNKRVTVSDFRRYSAECRNE